jgi:hypothetical protein
MFLSPDEKNISKSYFRCLSKKRVLRAATDWK